MGKILIKGGTVVNADRQVVSDVLIEDDKITAVGPDLSADGAEIIDAKGKFVMPGGIDTHTHMELPFMGTVAVDDFNWGTRAGAAGGTTMCIDFIIPTRGQSLVEAYKNWRAKADPKVNTDYALHCGITFWNEQVSEDMGTLVREHGVTSFKMFLAYKGVFQLTDEELYAAFARCKELGALAQVHAENGDLVHEGQLRMLRMGITGPEGHLLSRPEFVETEATSRAIAIAHAVNTPLYVVHCMSKGPARAIAEARARGQRVFGEPIAAGLGTDGSHVFNEDWRHAAAYVMGPPLRNDPTVREELMRHLAGGSLSTVGTDNCTFNADQKALGKDNFAQIPNGVNGIEDRLGIVWSNGVARGILTPTRFVEVTSANAAKLFGCYPRKGAVAPGSDADVIVWDGDRKRTISVKTHHHRVDFNVFEGLEVTGCADVTISRGRIVWRDGELSVEQGSGEYVSRAAYGAAFDNLKASDVDRDELKQKVNRKPYDGPVIKLP